MNNYAMAVKRTLDQNKENTNNNNVILSTSSTAPLNGSINRGTNIQGEQPPRNKWFDKNIRSTVNAKETEGGPRINGRLRFVVKSTKHYIFIYLRSIVNGINLNSLKFVKPARQCPRWDKPKHRIEEPNCPLWHPRERCQ